VGSRRHRRSLLVRVSRPAVVTPFVGRLMDVRGPRIVVELGVLTMGAGLILAAFVRQPWQLYLTLGALAGGGVNLLAYTGQSICLTNWFVRRRGLALSIAFSGVGVGSITILPWLQTLIANSGWRTACGLLASCSSLFWHPSINCLNGSQPTSALSRMAFRIAEPHSERGALRIFPWLPMTGPSVAPYAPSVFGGLRRTISAACSHGMRCRSTRRNT
jgi:MFS family permease